MSLVVQKYGGTSVADPERIRSVAKRVAARHRAGDSVVVIVSAMGHTTDELIRMAGEVSDTPDIPQLWSLWRQLHQIFDSRRLPRLIDASCSSKIQLKCHY
jgi:aspartate kinase